MFKIFENLDVLNPCIESNITLIDNNINNHTISLPTEIYLLIINYLDDVTTFLSLCYCCKISHKACMIYQKQIMNKMNDYDLFHIYSLFKDHRLRDKPIIMFKISYPEIQQIFENLSKYKNDTGYGYGEINFGIDRPTYSLTSHLFTL